MGTSQQLRIQETFVSLQGEGGLVGVPSSFLRISGCNLRCTWCDTPDSSWHPKGNFQDVSALIEFCAKGPRHVVITGGEPLLFAGVSELSQRLRNAGHHVTVETAGTVHLDGLRADLLSISPKLQNSTPHERAPHWVQRHNSRRYQPRIIRQLMNDSPWQLKYVVRAHQEELLEIDLREIGSHLDELDIPAIQLQQIFLMPQATDSLSLHHAYKNLVVSCQRMGFRLGQRLHIDLFGHTPGT